MKLRTKNTLRAIAKHLGLKVKFVSYFSDDIHGRLLPREKRILINASKPRDEHIFTTLHEIGHFLIHYKNPHRKPYPRILELHWKIEWLAKFCFKVRRHLRYLLNKESGREWEADLWTCCAFIYFAKHFGCRNELLTFLNRHPEKNRTFLLAAFGCAYGGTKRRIANISQTLSALFTTLSPKSFLEPLLNAGRASNQD